MKSPIPVGENAYVNYEELGKFMRIKLSPQYRGDVLTIVRTGDVLNINGADFDFGPLKDGSTLPSEAIECEYIVGPVERVGGKINLTLILPIQRSVFMESLPDIVDPVDGPVELPTILEIEHAD